MMPLLSHFYHSGAKMGVIRQQKNGRYQAIIRKKGFPSLSMTFAKRGDARDWLAVTESEMVLGTFRARREVDKMTFRAGLEKYRDSVTPTKKGSEQEKSKIRMLLRHPLADRPMAEIDGQAVAEYRDEQTQAGLSPSTIQKRLSLISSVFKTARQEWGVRVDNPVQQIAKPRSGRGRNRRFVGLEEKYLMAAMTYGEVDDEDGEPAVRVAHHGGPRNTTLLPLTRFALATAGRQGELLKLRWCDINMSTRRLAFYDTKNSLDRHIEINGAAWAVLYNLLFWAHHPPGSDKPGKIGNVEKAAGKSLKMFDSAREDTSPVFNTTATAVAQAWRRAVGRAQRQYLSDCRLTSTRPNPNFLSDLRFHDLRHEAISRLFEAGKGIMEVASISGHKDLRMLKRYTHLGPRSLNREE
jgi:integrase